MHFQQHECQHFKGQVVWRGCVYPAQPSPSKSWWATPILAPGLLCCVTSKNELRHCCFCLQVSWITGGQSDTLQTGLFITWNWEGVLQTLGYAREACGRGLVAKSWGWCWKMPSSRSAQIWHGQVHTPKQSPWISLSQVLFWRSLVSWEWPRKLIWESRTFYVPQ